MKIANTNGHPVYDLLGQFVNLWFKFASLLMDVIIFIRYMYLKISSLIKSFSLMYDCIGYRIRGSCDREILSSIYVANIVLRFWLILSSAVREEGRGIAILANWRNIWSGYGRIFHCNYVFYIHYDIIIKVNCNFLNPVLFISIH